MSTALTFYAQEAALRLLSYNVRNGKGMDNVTDYDRTAAVIKKAGAQVVALQELDSATGRSQGVDVLSVLAQKTGMHGVYGAAIPYNGGRYGVGILSREKPLRHYTVPLPGREEQRVLLVAEYKEFVLFNTHLSLTEEDRTASISIINKEAVQFTKPIFLLGDLNAEPSSLFLSQLKKDWQLLSGEATTFPATAPDKCIDYILGRNGKITVSHSEVMAEPMASDHRPVVVSLEVKKP
ncbi:endonuclease/exonuclease/phosphatase family protein [Flavisolibacter sp. BT320]|nr:endonuclease/exonuclease/phosphatase family protein [Flavisolibacter longurius]